MLTISAAEFQKRCLELVEYVSRTKDAVLITKRGRPVAKLIPADNERPSLIGRLEGIIRITGDIE